MFTCLFVHRFNSHLIILKKYQESGKPHLDCSVPGISLWCCIHFGCDLRIKLESATSLLMHVKLCPGLILDQSIRSNWSFKMNQNQLWIILWIRLLFKLIITPHLPCSIVLDSVFGFSCWLWSWNFNCTGPGMSGIGREAQSPPICSQHRIMIFDFWYFFELFYCFTLQSGVDANLHISDQVFLEQENVGHTTGREYPE